MMNKEKAQQYLIDFCTKNNLTLLYGSLFGSALYGTMSYDEQGNCLSDTDIKGVFLPKKNNLLLEKISDCFSYHSSDDKARNTKTDVDIEIWSLHNFLRMVERGDTGALDLLFSYTNKDTVLYCDNIWNSFHNNIEYLFNPTNTSAFLGYCQSQCLRYQLKAQRLDILTHLIEYLEKLPTLNDKLAVEINNIIQLFGIPENTYIRQEYIPIKAGSVKHINALRVLGSIHMESISLYEFHSRLKSMYNKYGKRSKKSIDLGNIDWKSIHHAARCILECKELILTGKIQFPLYKKDWLLDIKKGKLAYDYIIDWLSDSIEEINFIIISNEINKAPNKFNATIRNQLILDIYDSTA